VRETDGSLYKFYLVLYFTIALARALKPSIDFQYMLSAEGSSRTEYKVFDTKCSLWLMIFLEEIYFLSYCSIILMGKIILKKDTP